MHGTQGLMLKQGVKSVFKFKIQFSIILLLSLLASVILTVSTTTNRRLSHSYQEIVGGTQKFDSTYSLDVGVNTTADADRNFVPLMDLVGNAKNYTSVDATSQYNFVLNDSVQNGAVNNFLTRGIKSAEFYGAFTNFTTAWVGKNQIQDNISGNNKDQKAAMTNVLMSYFFQDLRTYQNDQTNADVAYLNNSAFGAYTLSNNNFWSKDGLVTDDMIDAKTVNYTEMMNKTKAMSAIEKNTIEVKETMYVFFAIQTLSERINYVLGSNEYNLKNEMDSLSITDANEFMFEFMFGTTGAGVTTPVNANYIGGYNNNFAKLDYATAKTANDDANAAAFVLIDAAEVNSNSSAKSISKFILTRGYRGNTNYVINTVNTDDKGNKTISYDKDATYMGLANELKTFQSTSQYEAKKFKGDLVKYLSVLQNETDWVDLTSGQDSIFSYDTSQGTFDTNTIAIQQKRGAAYLAHQRLASAATGFDLYMRKELLYNDVSTSKKYRAIVMEGGQQTTFKILKGTNPTSTGEIAISSQFAKRNNVKIGQTLKIGNGSFRVTGFAVDTYSFYPSADPLVPLPKAETDSLVYGSQATLALMSANSDNEDSAARSMTTTFNFFNLLNADDLAKQEAGTLTNGDLNKLRNTYMIYQNASFKNGKANAALQANLTDIESGLKAAAFFDYKLFDESTYKLSWTLYHMVFWIYSSITYIVAALIGIIALASLVVCVNKTISANSKQIGILKALGVNSKQIAVSYISYSFFIGFVAVPLGYIIGTALQFPIINIFLNYFSLPSDEMFFDWMGPLIAFVGFGVMAAIVGFITAYIKTNKPVLEITLNKKLWSKSPLADWMKRTVMKNSSFHARLALQLAASGKKSIILLIVTVFISSFLISAGLAIPAVAVNAKNVYFTNTKMRNTANMVEPLSNSPMSKDGITFWEGQSAMDKDYQNTALSDSIEGYYNNPNNYSKSNQGNSMLPSLQYIQSSSAGSTNGYKIETPYENIISGEGGIDIVNSFLSSAGNALAYAQGTGFSIGTIEQFNAYALNAANIYSKEKGQITTNTSIKDRITVADSNAGSVTEALPLVLSSLVGGFDSSTVAENGWKKALINGLLVLAPSFIKSYLETPSRYEQFTLGFQSSTYVPEEETYATIFKSSTSNHGNVSITGLDANQNAYKMSDSLRSDVFFNDAKGQEVVAKVRNILNNADIASNYSDIVYKGVTIWNASTRELTIPTANNKAANASLHMNTGDSINNLSTTTSALQIWSNTASNSVTLPTGAFIYDDTNYVANSAGFIQNYDTQTQGGKTDQNIYGYEALKTSDGNTHWYLDPNTIQGNHMTQNNQYNAVSGEVVNSSEFDANTGLTKTDKYDGIMNNAYMFGDYKYDDNGTATSSFIRPYYEYKNMQLYIPIEFAGKEEDLTASNAYIGDGTSGVGQVANYLGDTGGAYTHDASSNIKTDDTIAQYLWSRLTNSGNRKQFLNKVARVVKNEDVPNSVKTSYEKSGLANDSERYIVVNAYDPRMSSFDGGTTPAASNGAQDGADLSFATSGPGYWGSKAVNGQMLTKNGSSPVNYGLAKSVNLKTVGTINTYDSTLTVIDSDIANLLYGYSTARSTGYDYDGFVEGSNKKYSDNASGMQLYDLTNFTSRVTTDDLTSVSAVKSDNFQSYNPHSFYNTVLSNFDEPLSVTSSASLVSTGGKVGFANPSEGIGLQDYGISGYNFLAEKEALLNQITSVAIYIAILIVTAVAVASALLIMLVGDIYIASYKRFIVMLRSFGYGNVAIMAYVLGTVSVFSLAVWGAATALVWGGIAGAIALVAQAGFAIPFGVLWWSPVLCIVIMLISYLGSLMVSSRSARKEDVASMMTTTVE